MRRPCRWIALRWHCAARLPFVIVRHALPACVLCPVPTLVFRRNRIGATVGAAAEEAAPGQPLFATSMRANV